VAELRNSQVKMDSCNTEWKRVCPLLSKWQPNLLDIGEVFLDCMESLVSTRDKGADK